MTLRVACVAVLLGLMGPSPASAAPSTFAYDGASRVVTITIAQGGASVEIGASSTPQYTASSPTGLVVSYVNGGNCSAAAGSTVTAISCSGQVPKRTIINGSPQADSITGLTNAFTTPSSYNPDLELRLGGGDDTVQAGDGNDFIDLGEGDDKAINHLGADVLDGGPGDDTLTGGQVNDQLRGGAGRDTLVGGLGGDLIEGGDGLDTVSYEERTAGVTISLNRQPDDGEPGEGDNVASDVETIWTGAGDDTVNVRDGATQLVDCGVGADTLIADPFDGAGSCETEERSRDALPDVDADGVAAPADCDDRNPARRPGLVDVPGNGIDEDCSGADAIAPAVVTPTKLCTVPKLGKLSAAKARAKLKAAGCAVGRVRGSKKKSARVRTQTIPAKVEVKAGTKVGFTLKAPTRKKQR